MAEVETLKVRGDGPHALLPYRTLWAACFLGYASIGMTIQVIPTFVQQRIGAGPVAAGLAVTVGSLATAISRPIAGRMADRRGGRQVVMAGSILGVIGGLAHLIASHLASLIAARLILGAGEGALFTAAIGWVLAKSEPAHRGKIAGHFGLSMWAGLACGPIIGAALLSVAGYRAVWIVAACLPALAWALLLRSPRVHEHAHSDGDVRRALLPRAAWVPGLSMMFASVGYGIVAAFLVPRFLFLDLPGEEFALAIFGAAFLATRFLGSPAVDRWGAIPVLTVALVTEAVGLSGLWIAGGTGVVFLFTILTGAGISMLYPCLAHLVTQRALARERSAALGAMTSAWDIGLAAGGPVGGLVAGATSALPFAVGGAAALIALLPMALVAVGRSETTGE